MVTTAPGRAFFKLTVCLVRNEYIKVSRINSKAKQIISLKFINTIIELEMSGIYFCIFFEIIEPNRRRMLEIPMAARKKIVHIDARSLFTNLEK